jgi:hypothetical protein
MLKVIKNILFLFLVTVPIINTLGTPQIPDLLIHNGDTMSIFSNPLEFLYENDSIRPDFFGENEGCITTYCWRGYQAEWKIIDNQLYLDGIYSCCFHRDSVKANLENLFPKKYRNGMVKADWFTGNIIAPQGELVYYIHSGYASLYEKEIELRFENGKLVDKEVYDNSKSKNSVYAQNSAKLLDFIYSNIKWDILPLKTKNIKVWIKRSIPTQKTA